MALEDFGSAVDKRKEDIRKLEEKAKLEEVSYATPAVDFKKADTYKKTQWSIVGYSEFAPCSITVKSLDPGVYSFRRCDSIGLYVSKNVINVDDLLDFPDSVFEKVLGEIDDF